jgi:hypothetical protein
MGVARPARPRGGFRSKYDHCLVDLLYRQRNGELAWKFRSLSGNHEECRRHADFHGALTTSFQSQKARKEKRKWLRSGCQRTQDRFDRACPLHANPPQQSSLQIFLSISSTFTTLFCPRSRAKPHHQAYDRA